MRKIDLTNFQVATSETARHINRRIALNIIRRHQPMSRAELARRSGLQRSTVSAIISQLIAQGWVTEGASPTSGRGRRPRYLHLNVERAGILAVDVRPVTTRIGLAGLDARFVMQTEWPTPSTPVQFTSELVRTIETFRAAHPEVVYEGVGVSLPGRINESGRLLFAPNLAWGPVDLKPLLESAVGLPVAIENAASACALAELWFGRHPDNVRHLVAVTVSEGIGVGLLLNGQLVHGRDAMAGEFGHVTLDENGPLCSWKTWLLGAVRVQFGGRAALPGVARQRVSPAGSVAVLDRASFHRHPAVRRVRRPVGRADAGADGALPGGGHRSVADGAGAAGAGRGR